ncbi:ribosomal protein S6 [Cercophora samala]|uniref:Small ribosomal subunit protein bS6m n=1 Tax=Cercophora samala TaxID=330535 RepID=A0AA39ZHT9_9PEZI|nr:ribosomal protein S6 [Cercophora samala]
MLYETIGIVRAGHLPEVKELVLTAGKIILQQGGVIRDIRNWGTFSLPQAISRGQQRHTKGHYFIMRYDCGIKANEQVRKTLALDVRVIRSANVKLGNGKLETLSKFGEIRWDKLEGEV